MRCVYTTTLRPLALAGFLLLSLNLIFISGAVHGAQHEPGEDLAARLAAADRPEADKVRDAGRKPAEVVLFLGIGTGMQVIDLIAAGGYYTEVLAHAVGPKGQVYAQNPQFVLEFRDGANDKELTERLAGGRLPNVERLDRAVAELGIAPASIDAALTALNFHDIYNGRGAETANAFLAEVLKLLKPGGVLGIVDHSGGVGDDTELHRIDQAIVEKAALATGFEIVAKSDLLRNPADDRKASVFAPDLRGKTDRFVLRLRKPE